MSSNTIVRACCPAPYSDSPGYRLWPVEKKLGLYFLDGSEEQQSAVLDAIQEWEKYANVSSDTTSNLDDADIRITFQQEGTWSVIGTDAQHVDEKKPTISIAWVSDDLPWTKAVILHALGHVFGMLDEYKNVPRGGDLSLVEQPVIDHYKPFLADGETTKERVIELYNTTKTTNYARPDWDSVMLFFMPGVLNDKGIPIEPKATLSDYDKAFVTLAYPSNSKSKAMSVLAALDTAKVDEFWSTPILGYVQSQPPEFINAQATFNDWRKHIASVPASVEQV